MQINAKFSERDGRELAVAMLHELAALGPEALCIASEDRAPGTAQRNVVLSYVRALRGRDDLAAGFGAILTDYLALVLGGEVPDVADYECRIDALT